MVSELTSINGLFEEIDYLKKKAELLDEILRFYDRQTMTFDIPENWDLRRMPNEQLKKIPKSPRHKINENIANLLPFSEIEHIVNWNQIGEMIADPINQESK